jgi:pimeloyl-ACP methyl ester carboxylesterase
MILACPNLPGGDWKSPVGERMVLAVRRDVLASFNVKADMVTLGGFSAGAIGTWALGARYPDLFAAIVPRSGRGPGDDDLLHNLSGVPVYAMHGTADRNIPVTATRDVVRSLRKEGLFAKGSVYKERRGVAHDFGSDLNRSVAQWLVRKKRPSPRQAGRLDMTVLPDRVEDVAWFVKVDSSTRQRLRVTVAKDNVVNVRLSEPGRVSRLTVLLNKQVVDPARPVTLVVNGRTLRVPAEDDAALMLSTYDESLDLRRSFSNRFVVGREQIADLPPDRSLETAGR